MKKIQEVTVSPDDAKEISVNAAVVAVLSELVSILTVKSLCRRALIKLTL